MSRLFNLMVLDDDVDGTNATESSSDHADTLGQADILTIHVELSGASGVGASDKIEVDVLHSNNGRNYELQVNRQSAVIGTGAKSDTFITFSSDTIPLGAFVKISVRFSDGSTATGRFRVYVCGRST